MSSDACATAVRSSSVCASQMSISIRSATSTMAARMARAPARTVSIATSSLSRSERLIISSSEALSAIVSRRQSSVASNGTPLRSCQPCNVVRPCAGKAGAKTTIVRCLNTERVVPRRALSKAAISAPMWPRSVESIFLNSMPLLMFAWLRTRRAVSAAAARLDRRRVSASNAIASALPLLLVSTRATTVSSPRSAQATALSVASERSSAMIVTKCSPPPRGTKRLREPI
jgi:hypothetical protein